MEKGFEGTQGKNKYIGVGRGGQRRDTKKGIGVGLEMCTYSTVQVYILFF